MTYIDAAVLNLTEWFCRRFQVLTGRTNVWLAVQLTNLSIIVYFVWAGVYFWRSDPEVRIVLGLFCGGLLYVLAQTIFKVPIEAYESNAYRRVANGYRNPRRVRDALLRIPFLTLSVVLFYPILLVYINLRLHIALLSYSLIVLTTVVLYLLACDPLPPCAGKVTEWLRGPVPSQVAPAKSSNGHTRFSHAGPSAHMTGLLPLRALPAGRRARDLGKSSRFQGTRIQRPSARESSSSVEAPRHTPSPHSMRGASPRISDTACRERSRSTPAAEESPR